MNRVCNANFAYEENDEKLKIKKDELWENKLHWIIIWSGNERNPKGVNELKIFITCIMILKLLISSSKYYVYIIVGLYTSITGPATEYILNGYYLKKILYIIAHFECILYSCTLVYTVYYTASRTN